MQKPQPLPQDSSISAPDLPLSTAQADVWYAQQLAPTDALYNIGGYVEIFGSVNPGALRRSIHQALQDADSFLVTFALTEQGPRQVYTPVADVALPVLDLTGEGDPRVAALAWMEAEMDRPFDLSAGPLNRFALIKVAPERVLWFCAFHHLITDLFGSALFLRRTAELYNTATGAHEPSPPELTPWSAVLQDENEYRASGRAASDRDYWRGQLRNRPDAVTMSGLPPEWPAATVQSMGSIPRSIVTRLEELGAKHRTGLSAVLLAAIALYLSRRTGNRDVILGMPVAARTNSRLRQSAGFVANVVPLRLQIDPAKGFGALVEQTGVRVLEAFRHQRYWSSALRGDLGVAANEPSIYGTLVNFLPSDVKFAFGGQPVKLNLFTQSRRVEDLSITVHVGADGCDMTLYLDGSGKHYDARALHGHRQGLLNLLQAAVLQPEAPERVLPVLAGQERQLILGQWSGSDWSGECLSLVELFEAQVQRSPDAVAVIAGPRQLSYAELNIQSNTVASQLMERGVAAESVIGLWADRSLEMVVGMLGILKAGGAYLPLDPAYPAERLQLMMEDADPLLLVSGAGHRVVDLGRPIPRLIIDLSAVNASGCWPNPGRRHPAANAAYVIYTSGSTGRPKAVVVTHSGLSALAAAQVQRLNIGPGSRVLQFASLNFDGSVWEILSALSNGAALVLGSAESASGAALHRALVGDRISHAALPPAVLATIDRTADLALECLVVAGEACPAALVDRWGSGLRLINSYGPTESTVCATNSGPLHAGASVHIGTPIGGTRVYVLDAALEPVPVGVPGELYLAGVGLARGYLKRPALTAERFVANPFGPPGTRMYRTGDVVRWREDGALEFLGRADQQFKLRGYRIELGEIEAELLRQAQIEQAAVTLRDDGAVGKYLAAYVVSRDGQPVEAAEARRALGNRLPQYMIPSTFITVPSLPLTPSGKLDRRALPIPSGAARLGGQFEPPQTATEVRLAAIWRQILRVEQVGRGDDFFAVGGHSLLALQVIARVRDVFHLELSLQCVFDAPTLESLASRIDESLAAGAAHGVARIAPRAWDGPAPLSYSQERMWLIQSLNPGTTAYNMAAALRIRGSVDTEALSQSFDVLMRRHEILRSRIRLTDDQPRQIIEPWRPGTLRIADLRAYADPEGEASRLIDADVRGVFDLSRDPVIRARLLQTADHGFLFALVVHHIASDQWSMGVFGRELAALYNQRRARSAAQLPPLDVSYRDFAHWQRSGALAPQLARQLEFWSRKLADLPTVDLPVDFARPKVWTMNGSFLQREIPPALFAAVGRLARGAGSTMFMTLFAGFATLLHRISGQRDIAIGVPVANRTHSAIEGLVGTFVNTVVLRTDLQGDPDFNELLNRVRATALEAFANQEVSFDRLVQELGQRGDRSRAPLTQVLFNVTNAPMHGIELAGLTWEIVTLDRGGAQFELAFSVDTEVTRTLSVEYNTDLFERATVERLVSQYFTLLEAAAAAPAKRISRLTVLPAEQLSLLRNWNVATASFRPAVTFARLFEAQAVRSPAAVAVSCEGAVVRYAELNERANVVARALRGAGAGRGATVAVCMPRSASLLVALLAVQKSGSAYVPLDPEFPAERLRYMLSDSGARVLIASGALPVGLEVPDGTELIDIAVVPGQCKEETAGNLSDGPGLQDPAYVLYTSGSTGRPKGVVVSHGALTNFLCSMRERPGIDPTDVVAAVTTISFDIAGLELYLPLMVGARVELVPKSIATDGASLARLLEEGDATVLQATPATWRMLLEADWRGAKSLRALVGGEALPRTLADQILSRVRELWNMYGPTETTIWSTLERVEPGCAAISIGKPIANTQVHVLDSNGALAPIGVTGEICIGGEGVALGYHGCPALTAERFVADAYSESRGGRLYRTGDLGRWGSDGKLYHLGRSDHQVKIRGFRIELGEIEKALAAHSAIQHAVASVREARPDDPRLVAYVTFRDGEDATSTDLKRFLRNQLPDYMIPSIVMPLAGMPLTLNGKIDRAALPDPFVASADEALGGETPATEMEQMLAAIWQSVLKIERIAPTDNFFELGGYSLLSLKVANLIGKRTGRQFDPRALFFHNLREVAGMLEPDPSASEPEVR